MEDRKLISERQEGGTVLGIVRGYHHVRISHIGIGEVFMFMLFAFLNRSRELVRTVNISDICEVKGIHNAGKNEGGMGRNNDKKGLRPRKRHCLKRKWPISFTVHMFTSSTSEQISAPAFLTAF